MEESDKIGVFLSDLELPAPVGLLDRVLFAIAKRERRSIFLKLAVYSGASVISAVVLFFSWSAANAAFYRNGTSQLFSLLFSDFKSVLANWTYFVLSIAESLPVLSVVYVLLSFLAFSVLASLAVTSVKNSIRMKNYGLKHA